MILFGKTIAYEIHKEIEEKVATLPSPPGLAVVLVGNHPSSRSYVNMKQRTCSKIGIRSFVNSLPETVKESELLALINKLNQNPEIDGILIQLPLPSHIDPVRVIELIDPNKDVDGFHPLNMGKLLLGLEDGFIPCTPLGIATLLKRYQISVAGKHVVIVGRSQIVGKPLAALLMQKGSHYNATVTVAHRHTEKLPELTKMADILVAAIGSPSFIKADMVKEGAVVIDVGITREKNAALPTGYQLVGDVDFREVEKKCTAITPVPNGVGPMTVAMLLHNTLISYQRRHS